MYFRGKVLAQVEDVGYNNVNEIINELMSRIPETIPSKTLVQIRIETRIKTRLRIIQERLNKIGMDFFLVSKCRNYADRYTHLQQAKDSL